MGCDIHLYVETFDPGSKTWGAVFPPKNYLPFWWDDWTEEEEWESERGKPELPHWSISRDYYLFSALANVRNADKSVVPIDMPRGLPRNVSNAVKQEHKREEGDAHSMSWLTLTELQKYNWNLVTVEQLFEIMYAKSNQRYAQRRGEDTARKLAKIQRDACQESVDRLNDQVNSLLSTLEKLGEPDQVRIVFWFDN